MLRHRNQRVRDDCAAGRDRRHSDPWKSRVTAAEELGDWCCLPRESGFSSFYGWTIGSPIPSEKSPVCQWCPDQFHVAFFTAKFWAKSKLHSFPHHLKSLHGNVSHSQDNKVITSYGHSIAVFFLKNESHFDDFCANFGAFLSFDIRSCLDDANEHVHLRCT